MTYSIEQIKEVLSQVVHPETNQDIISMGLVREIQSDGKKISFNLVFKSVKDPFKNSIKNAAIRALKGSLAEDLEVNIAVLTDFVPTTNKSTTVLPNVKNIIAVASGKGGVGKSTVATNLAVACAKLGYNVGLIDADIFGPSIPKMLGAEEKRPFGEKRDGKDFVVPVENHGIKLLSIGFFIDPDDAVVWRGPMASNAFKQLMTDAVWDDIDYMFIDLPPGTSDIHLTLVQTVSVTGAVIVTTPQDVALADAIKGIKMFAGDKVNVPILGLVENMSWFTPEELPDNKYYIFGKDGGKKLAEKLNIPLLGQIPLVQGIRENGDIGKPSALENSISGKAFGELAINVLDQIKVRNETIAPTKKVEISR